MARIRCLVGARLLHAGAILLIVLITTTLSNASPRDELVARGLQFNAAAFVERAGAGDLEAVKLFVAAGINPNAPKSTLAPAGTSAMFEASLKGHSDVVTFLLNHGADIDSGGAVRSTALMGASLGGYRQLVKYLLDNGAAINKKNYQDQSALHLAAVGGSSEIVQLLATKGADVNAKGAYGQTPLIYAASVGSADTVRVLLEHRAEVNARDYNMGLSALDRTKDPEIVRMLRAAGGKKASELR
ncbi:MAG: ankyrin repeat domain-containing protein [SAR324 cluster bacterium]|nr:ankyrin repeat domain-containing protein [SAR324 cluster bacterium]